ncbi:hypothetical protein HSX11_23635 [Oxalobacteraceae bacterium]|nr:hypothetical protein [Oxalobacteraceae bacterium]
MHSKEAGGTQSMKTGGNKKGSSRITGKNHKKGPRQRPFLLLAYAAITT